MQELHRSKSAYMYPGDGHVQKLAGLRPVAMYPVASLSFTTLENGGEMQALRMYRNRHVADRQVSGRTPDETGMWLVGASEGMHLVVVDCGRFVHLRARFKPSCGRWTCVLRSM